MDDEDDVIIIDDGEPEDVGGETTPPVDEETVPDVHDEGDRPDVDWDEEGVEDDADAQREFTSQPVPPYRAGDTWASSGTLYICVNGKAEGQAFSADDWVPAVVPETAPAETQRTVTIVETITDFSAESIASYQSRGATAYAIYDDGTRVQVAWSAVREPEPTAPETVANEALIIAQATNQHFWHRSSDPDQDGAGTGAFVTDEEQATFLEAIAAGTEPTTARPLHNLLMNAEGILLRAAKRIRAAFTPSGVAFYDGSGNNAANIVASFGAGGAQIGKDGDSHLELDYHSMQLVDKEGNTYFHVSDLRDASGVATITEAFVGDGSTVTFSLSLTARSTDYTVTVGGVEVTSDVTKTSYRITFSTAPAAQSEIVATYTTASSLAKAYTLGIRASDSNIGPFSVAEGYETTASGYLSHAEGKSTTASGDYSHAEGSSTTASGDYSHAEGLRTTASGYLSHAEGFRTTASDYYSHAEGGGTTASGYFSHAEGISTTASGYYSHAQNNGTIAAGADQTAIGRNNISDTTSAFIIGNGTSDTARSNALTVDWNGNVRIAGSVRDLSGNDKYLPLAGGEITGAFTATGASIRVKSPTIDRDGADPSETLYSPSVIILDKDGETIGYFQVSRGTTGTNTLNMYAVNEVGGEAVYNRISIIVRKDGTLGYSVSDQSAFLSALGLAVVSSSPTISNATAEHFKVKRQGSTVNLQVTGLKVSSALANGSSVSLGANIIPSAYRPEVPVRVPILLNTANPTGAFLVVSSSGGVSLYNRSGASLATSTALSASATWIV